jgi:hypothetical protein
MLRQLKRNVRKSLKLQEKPLKKNIMLHLRSKLRHTRKHKSPLKRLTKLLKLKERPRKKNRLLLIRRLWLIEDPNSRKNSEMFGQRVTRVFHTYK